MRDGRCNIMRRYFTANEVARYQGRAELPIPVEATIQTKSCTHPDCPHGINIQQPISNFASATRTADGYNNWCRDCVKRYNKAYHKRRYSQDTEYKERRKLHAKERWAAGHRPERTPEQKERDRLSWLKHDAKRGKPYAIRKLMEMGIEL